LAPSVFSSFSVYLHVNSVYSLQLLDDNRELYIPETQATIKAHPRFMLFATQNPPGQYGGRKVRQNVWLNQLRILDLSWGRVCF